jgi:hypothetical protein
VVKALGHKRSFVRERDLDIKEELKIAAPWAEQRNSQWSRRKAIRAPQTAWERTSQDARMMRMTTIPPKAQASARDILATGCWAEHDDGSLLLIGGTEGECVAYWMFDMGMTPPATYRNALPRSKFEKLFACKGDFLWTWKHDKTPFPWARLMMLLNRDWHRERELAIADLVEPGHYRLQVPREPLNCRLRAPSYDVVAGTTRARIESYRVPRLFKGSP